MELQIELIHLMDYLSLLRIYNPPLIYNSIAVYLTVPHCGYRLSLFGSFNSPLI